MGGRTPLDDASSQGEALAEAGVPSTSIILERVPTSKSIFQQSEVPDATPHGPTPPGKQQADTSDAEDDEQPHAALLVPETPGEPRSARGWQSRSRRPAREPLSSRERALWHWANMDDLDTFLRELYGYCVGKGFWCILLARLLHLLTIAFVLGFSTFLGGCIDYSAIRHDGELSEAIVPHCVTRLSKFYFVLFVMVASMFGWQAILFGIGIRRLLVLRDVYTHLLEIPPADVATTPWHEVVQRLTRLAEAHPTLAFSYRDGVPLDALSVANRIMRQDNYLVALVNRELLDVDLPIPRGMWLAGPLRSILPGLTKAFEWNLRFCVLGFVFTPQGRFRRQFLHREYRADLINGLRRRFVFMALLNALFAPFIVLYLVAYCFFRYFEEYHQNPATLGSRQYTPLAHWKFREYNELPHLFQRRCHQSYEHARCYMEQFPNHAAALLARFVAFVAGSFTAVLLLATAVDPDVFVHYDLAPSRNVLFFIGVFGTVLAVARSLIPDEHLVVDPAAAMTRVVQYTHFCPPQWTADTSALHSRRVLRDFSRLYALKVVIFAHELLSVLVTPLMLYYYQREHAERLVDFFRECTVLVPGMGHVCVFAAFDRKQAPGGSKMDRSIASFQESHPGWTTK